MHLALHAIAVVNFQTKYSYCALMLYCLVLHNPFYGLVHMRLHKVPAALSKLCPAHDFALAA